MNEIAQQNKAAWEEAFDVRVNSFGDKAMRSQKCLREDFFYKNCRMKWREAGVISIA